jgi:hypothetical protein
MQEPAMRAIKKPALRPAFLWDHGKLQEVPDICFANSGMTKDICFANSVNDEGYLLRKFRE